MPSKQNSVTRSSHKSLVDFKPKFLDSKDIENESQPLAKRILLSMQTEAGKLMVQKMVASAAKQENSKISSPPKEKEPELLLFPSRSSLVVPNFEKPDGTIFNGKTTNVLRKREYNQAFNQSNNDDNENENEKMNENVSYLNNWPIHDYTNKENQEDFFNTESNFKQNDSISKANIFDSGQEIKMEILHRSEDNSSSLYVDYKPNSDNQGEPEISFNFTYDNLKNEIKSIPTVYKNINGNVNINDVKNVSINIDFSNLVLNTETNDEVVKGRKFDIPSDLEIDARLQAELDSLLPSEESEIDARLQAELDSLPFIEVDNTEDKELDEFMKSLFVYEGRPEVVEGMVVEEVPTTASAIEGPQTQIRVPLGSDPKNCAQISYAAVENQMPVDEMQVPHKDLDLDLDNPIFFPLVGAPNSDFLQPMRTFGYFRNGHGEDIPVSFVMGPDGLVTNVSMVSDDGNGIGLPLDQQMESLTAAQLDQILKSGRTYLAKPPGAKSSSSSSSAPNRKMVPKKLEEEVPDDEGLPREPAVEDEEADYEEIGVSDTFAEYWPSKLKLGKAHPDPVVETATLSSVELPDINMKLALANNFEAADSLSALQMEAVVYACQAHQQILPSGERAGFLLGDGAGVGKGRAIAGIIYENYLHGRKRALWISVSSDLKFDAERDLSDIGADDKIPVVALSKFKYSRIDSQENDNFKKGVIFCTYTSLIGESQTSKHKYRTRLLQLVHWLTRKFDGVIVFDECHKAKNLSLMNGGKSTKTGTTVLELQQLCPKARVVYASATGASEPRNMAYMVRLGLWGRGTAYAEFPDFVNAVEKRGIGAMEIVAMDMKLRGTYIARQLSFKDVSFRIEEILMSKDFRKVYNMSAELWAEIHNKLQRCCRLMSVENRIQKIITCQFWCAHQRFFKNLCIASKLNQVVKMTRIAIRTGKAVVIGLQSTGESRTLEHLDRNQGTISTFVSTSKMILQSFVEKHFPAPNRDAFRHLVNTGEFLKQSLTKKSRSDANVCGGAEGPDRVSIGWRVPISSGSRTYTEHTHEMVRFEKVTNRKIKLKEMNGCSGENLDSE